LSETSVDRARAATSGETANMKSNLGGASEKVHGGKEEFTLHICSSAGKGGYEMLPRKRSVLQRARCLLPAPLLCHPG